MGTDGGRQEEWGEAGMGECGRLGNVGGGRGANRAFSLFGQVLNFNRDVYYSKVEKIGRTAKER